MKKVLRIKVKGLKDLLNLFDSGEVLENLSLGDTWHPSSGFVDESILDGKSSIREILDFPYEFEGLVSFETTTKNIGIKLIHHSNKDREYEEYEISGAAKSLSKLLNKIVELDAYNPGKYCIETVEKW